MSKAREDEELVRRAAARDKDAFRQLVERYQRRAMAIAYEVVRRKEDAEDVVQESFVKAYLSLPDFRGQSAFYTWFYRIVYNLAVDYRRKVARRGGEAAEFDERQHENTGAVGNEPIPGPQEVVLRKERASRIQLELSKISEDHRMVIVLREVDGLSYEEISDVLGISKGTVMSRLHYARKRLQKTLRDVAIESNVRVTESGDEAEPVSEGESGSGEQRLSVSRNTL